MTTALLLLCAGYCLGLIVVTAGEALGCDP